MTLPSLPCTAIDVGPQGLTVTLPGGGVVSLCYPTAGIPSTLAATRALLAQLNTSLAPLAPFVKIVDCLASVPDIVWNPASFISKFIDIAALVPPANLAALVGDVLDVLIAYMQGTYNQIEAFITQEALLLASATKATTLGNVALQLHVDCASTLLTAQIQSMNDGMAPLNALVTILNTLLGMVPGAPTVPTLANLGTNMSAALAPLAAAISAMQAVRAALP